MMEVTWATPLYEFLRHCNRSHLEKSVLDCGAGGSDPPLSLFYQHGYRTYGIDIDIGPLEQAHTFCREKGMSLNVFRGDMRSIPFSSEAFGNVYSFNAIGFMTKPDIAISMKEIERVLKRGGLCFVNFESVDDPDNRPFCETAPAMDLLKSERFAKYKDKEADVYFEGFQILRKEKRWVKKLHAGKELIQVYIEYIARKK
jgi:ubiquinone/menaquinone biosynthesis C-methylase UbiE